MRYFNFISIKLTFYLIIGILLGYYFTPPLKPIFLSLALLVVLFIISLKKQKRNGFPFFGVVSAFTTIALGLFIVSFSNPKNNQLHYANHLNGEKQEWKLKIHEVLKPSSYSERYIVKALSLDRELVDGRLILSRTGDSGTPPLHVDDELVVFAMGNKIGAPLNPHQFDYQDFLKKQHIYHQIHIPSNQFLLTKNRSKTIFGYASGIRNHLIQQLKKENFGEQELAVIQALLLGQRNDISEETYTDYKNAAHYAKTC